MAVCRLEILRSGHDVSSWVLFSLSWPSPRMLTFSLRDRSDICARGLDRSAGYSAYCLLLERDELSHVRLVGFRSGLAPCRGYRSPQGDGDATVLELVLLLTRTRQAYDPNRPFENQMWKRVFWYRVLSPHTGGRE